MNTLCRECGKPAAPEYTDEHDGLCMACVHRDRRKFIDDASFVTAAQAFARLRDAFADIDHDMAQPQTSDPIRDAIDRACVDLFNGKR